MQTPNEQSRQGGACNIDSSIPTFNSLPGGMTEVTFEDIKILQEKPVEAEQESMDINNMYLQNRDNPAKYAFKLLQKMFTHNELVTSNFNGTRGKKKFDERKMALFYENIEQKFGIKRKEDLAQLTAKVGLILRNYRRVRNQTTN